MEKLQFRLNREQTAAILTATLTATVRRLQAPSHSAYAELDAWVRHRYILAWGMPPTWAAALTGDAGPHRLTLRMDAVKTLALLEALADALRLEPDAPDAAAWQRLEAWARHRYVSTWAAPPPRNDTASCSYTG